MIRSAFVKLGKYLVFCLIVSALGLLAAVLIIPPDPYTRLAMPQKYDPFEAAAEIKGIDPIIFKALYAKETSSGTNIGDYYVINRLDQPGRDFLLLICGENGLDPYKEKGGSAGEVGGFQFLPETWLIDCEDGNGDGRRNPNDLADSLLAVGNYLNRHGYEYDVWEAVRRFNGNDEKSHTYVAAVKKIAIELGWKPRKWNLVKTTPESL